jgi:hypothetical protein
MSIWCYDSVPRRAIVYQRVIWINEYWFRIEKTCRGVPCGRPKHDTHRGLLEAAHAMTQLRLTRGRSLPSEKREPEVLNHIHEGSAEKKLGGEADDTEGNDDHKQKKDYSADF